MFNLRQQLCDEAQTWLGTPWKHQHMIKGHGVDCIGLVAGSMNNVGIKATLPSAYAPDPIDDSLRRLISAEMQTTERPMLGDIILFKMNAVNHHVGLYLGDGKFIHAHRRSKRRGQVTIDSLEQSNYWNSKVVCFFDLLTYQGFRDRYAELLKEILEKDLTTEETPPNIEKEKKQRRKRRYYKNNNNKRGKTK